MAPAPDVLSAPGSSSYSSDTLNVGDGTWDYTKNTFLLPPLVGLDFDTMQYNGMSNRFSTLTEYHSLILGHGVLAAITFLFIIPFSVMTAKFYVGRPGYAVRYHAYLNVLAVGFTTIIFILGFFAVGRPRSLSNPHHGIGVAIYVLILVQAIGGRFVRHIRGQSFRLHVHRWSGRIIALLGIAQVPLGLTLYGSPKYTFILYALWMTFLLLLYFILDYRDEGRRVDHVYVDDRTEYTRTSRRKSGGGGMSLLAPLAAGAGIWALLRGRKKDREERRERSVARDESRSRSRSRSRSYSRSRMTSRSRAPVDRRSRSRRGSESYVEEEKYTDRRRSSGGGGFMTRMLGVGAALGAGALVSRLMSGQKKQDRNEDYSAVATDTPSRRDRPRRHRDTRSEYSDAYTEEVSRRTGRRSPLLPGPGGRALDRPGTAAEPMTPPRPSHVATSTRLTSAVDASDYSSYASPSRREETPKKSGSAAKGLLAGLRLGWFAKKMKDRRDRQEDDRLRMDEDDRRAGNQGSRFTGDGYPSPTRQPPRRRISRHRPPPSAVATTVTGVSELSEEASTIEPRGNVPYDPAPPGGVGPHMRPAPVPVPIPVTPQRQSSRSHSRSQSRSRHDTEPVAMPAMPPDPQGILHRESGSEEYSSGGYSHGRDSSRRRREGEAAAAAAVASASVLAAEEDRRRRDRSRDASGSSQPPIGVKVRMDNDRDRVTLRRVTAEETAQTRREARRRRRDSVSTLSGFETSGGRYRRDSSSQRRSAAEAAAERHVVDDRGEPLSPPNPAFAAGRRPKDSAYYSNVPPASSAGPGDVTTSSIGSPPPTSRATWSGMSPSPGAPKDTSSAADRRRRRRQERNSRPPTTVDFD